MYFAIFLLLIFGLLLWREYRPISTPQLINENGEFILSSISELEEINIGGMKQWIQIRGEDISNPVILWLHGGPSAAQMPISKLSQALEKDFIVVHWDQRGAGKSNPDNFDERTMSFEQYLEDTHQLTEYLKQKLCKEKIYLIGHSWGTKIGITISKDYPEDYYAYVGVSQLVSNNQRSQEISYHWLTEKIENNNKKDLLNLKELGKPPYGDHNTYVKFIKMVDSYGGGMDIGMAKLAFIALQSKEYRLSDFKRWIVGSNRGSGPMWSTYNEWDAFKEVPELDIPVYFFSGKNDYNTPLQLVKEYYDTLIAPEGKKLVTFEDSSHTPFIKEPDKFYKEMKKVKEETYAE